MNYQISASSVSQKDAQIQIKNAQIDFGTTPESANTLPNPAELFLGSFAACMLKNVARFSEILKFSYSHAELDVASERLQSPPRMENITYKLTIYSNDTHLNKDLLQRNLEKHGTIYNTVKLSSAINGTIVIVTETI